MELINEIISLYQKGESIEKISSTLYLTPAFINYIIDLSKDYNAAKIIEKFKNMAEERPKDVSIPELKELIYKGFMPHMMAYLLKTEINSGTAMCAVPTACSAVLWASRSMFFCLPENIWRV